MDWAEVSRELAKAAKLYKIFEAGTEAAQELVNAEHRLLNFQAAIPIAEEKLASIHREEELVQGAVQEAKRQLADFTARVAQVGPQARTAEADLARALTDLVQVKADVAEAKVRQSAQQDEATTRLAQTETAWQKITAEITKLRQIRDALKTSLAQV